MLWLFTWHTTNNQTRYKADKYSFYRCICMATSCFMIYYCFRLANPFRIVVFNLTWRNYTQWILISDSWKRERVGFWHFECKICLSLRIVAHHTLINVHLTLDSLSITIICLLLVFWNAKAISPDSFWK